MEVDQPLQFRERLSKGERSGKIGRIAGSPEKESRKTASAMRPGITTGQWDIFEVER